MYADDTVILAKSKEELQTALSAMYLYCDCGTWKLNHPKPKLLYFAIENASVITCSLIMVKL